MSRASSTARSSGVNQAFGFSLPGSQEPLELAVITNLPAQELGLLGRDQGVHDGCGAFGPRPEAARLTGVELRTLGGEYGVIGALFACRPP